MAKPDLDRAETGERRQTQPGVQGADGRKDRPMQPTHDHDEKSTKGGQIAQDHQQSTGLGSGQS
jgi:hypothetical protein